METQDTARWARKEGIGRQVRAGEEASGGARRALHWQVTMGPAAFGWERY